LHTNIDNENEENYFFHINNLYFYNKIGGEGMYVIEQMMASNFSKFSFQRKKIISYFLSDRLGDLKLKFLKYCVQI